MKVLFLVIVFLAMMAASIQSSEWEQFPPLSDASTFTLGSQPIQVDTKTHRLVDEHHREVYFHGINVVVKGFPWMPETEHWTYLTSFSAKDMQELQDLGLNGIRLGTMWPGAEPVNGSYNFTYIQALKTLVQRASSYGIYSLMDMHQDVLSEKFCGEGVPLWAAVPNNASDFPFPVSFTPYQVNKDGVPSGKECGSKSWAEYYFTYAAGSAFQHIYDNHLGLRNSFSKFWKTIASAMKEVKSSVLGYELMNEPWAGDVIKDPSLLVPPGADKKNLQPTWDEAATAIRQVDTTHAIFFESIVWDWLYTGFSHVPGGSQWGNMSVLSYHFYVPPDFSIPVQFDARHNDMKRLGCGGMLTEFALKACAGCGDVQEEKVMDACDAYFQSWLVWEYKPFAGNRTGWSNSVWHPNGTENYPVAYNLSRTYAQVVAGVSTLSQFHIQTGTYVLKYLVSSSVTKPESKIYLSERLHYPHGFNVTVTANVSGVQVWWNQTARNHVHVYYHPQSTPVGTEITAKITRRS